MSRGYSFDFRPTFLHERHPSDSVPCETSGVPEYAFESEIRPNVFVDDLKEGMTLWFVGDITSRDGKKHLPYEAYHIEVTHVYSNVLFYRICGHPEMGELVAFGDSFICHHRMYPEVIVTDSRHSFSIVNHKILKKLVRVVIDDDPNSIGKYDTSFDYFEVKS